VLLHLDRTGADRLEVVGHGFVGGQWSPDGRQLVGAIRNTTGGVSGIAVYAPATRLVERLSDSGIAPHWLPGGQRIAFFDRRQISILDVASRRLTVAPVSPPTGVTLHQIAVPPRLSLDASTLYVRQALEQGDIWMVRFHEGR
jgi:hypothetical protein